MKGLKDIIAILDASKFAYADLIEILNHVKDCFPEDYQIFKVYEQQYKKNIEKRIIPYLEDEVNIKDNYGCLIKLLEWVEGYEDVLQRAGCDEADYTFLKIKVK